MSRIRNYIGGMLGIARVFDPKIFKCLGCNTMWYDMDEFLAHPCVRKGLDREDEVA